MASGPEGAASFFSEDHRQCDALWSELEAAADRGGKEALSLWQRFDAAMRRHFDMEEQVLFPEIERVTGMSGMGPTEVMRSEHAQMRGVLAQMAEEVRRGDFQALLDHGDTLLMLTQQHNVKEEGVLYPLADRSLSARWPSMLNELQRFDVG